MRTTWVWGLAVLVLVLVGTVGAGVAAADGDDAFAVVPEGMYVEASVDDPTIEAELAAALGVEERVVTVDSNAGVVEVGTDEVTASEFVAALEAAGVEASESDVRDRPTERTVEEVENVLTRRYELRNIDATVEHHGDHLFVDPSERGAEARDRAAGRGVEMLATVPGDEGLETVVVLTAGDVRSIGSATQQQGHSFVPVSLTGEGGQEFGAAMRESGYDQQGGTTCRYDTSQSLNANLEEMPVEDRCLLTVHEDEVVYASGISAGLATSFRDGSFDENPRFRTHTETREQAQEIELALRAGSLPAEVAIRSPDEVSEDGVEGQLDSITADGPGFGPFVAVVGLVGGLLAGYTRRRWPPHSP